MAVTGRGSPVYRVEVKPSAEEANPAVVELVSAEGRVLEFESRGAASELASRLSERGGRVRIQTAAPQDPAAVEGYLLRFPRTFSHEPKASATRGLTFDVEANLYGELGRSVVHGRYGVSPGVRYALFEALPDVSEGTHTLRPVPEPALPDDVASAVSWRPDCRIEVRRDGSGAVERAYYCEIKTGEASFQRGQLDDMKAVARTHDVLKIRVDVEALPAEYTLRIDRVDPD